MSARKIRTSRNEDLALRHFDTAKPIKSAFSTREYRRAIWVADDGSLWFCYLGYWREVERRDGAYFENLVGRSAVEVR